ncbi:MAG: hypothetical protein C0402_15170 [Thermodesulfovibrio sp.]|nr:hypothetical protein [Thermodesulfovibrio sp.]
MSRQNWEGYFEAVRVQAWRKALEVLNHIALSENTNPLVYLRMGDICQRLGDTGGAVRAYHHSAGIETLAGFRNKALALYKIILRIRPDDTEALRLSQVLLKELDAARTPHLPPLPVIEAPHAGEQPKVDVLTGRPAPEVFPADQARIQDRTPGRETELDEAVIGGGGIASIEGFFSSLNETALQKTFDDLMVPLSERQAAGSLGSELFDGMSEDEVSSLLAGLEMKTYPDRAAVVEEGDAGDSLFIIKSGTARVVAHMFGRELELADLGEGDFFGEVAFLTGRPRTASVIAVGPLEVYEISRLDIEQLIERNPEVMGRLEGFYETRVRDTVNKILPK